MTGWMLGLIGVGGLIGLLVHLMGNRDRYRSYPDIAW